MQMTKTMRQAVWSVMPATDEKQDKEGPEMKKVLTLGFVLILAFSMLTACGGNSGNSTPGGGSENTPTPPASTPPSGSENNTSAPANQDAEVIKASELITAEDAGRLLGGSISVKPENDDRIDTKSFGSVTIIYNSDAGSTPYYVSVRLYQDALLDENNAAHKALIQDGGTSSYQKGLRSDRENKELAVIIDDLGDWACITGFEKLDSYGTHTLEIGYGDFCISITIPGWPKGNTFNDEEKIAWKTEKLTEAGRLAFERLKALL